MFLTSLDSSLTFLDTAGHIVATPEDPSTALLETVNYIEHYGLQRDFAKTTFERVKPAHSWNSNHLMGRLTLFELSRHSDHHYLASRKYQILRHMEDAPQMPTGYPGMILLALFPPIWFKVMHRQMDRFGITPR